MTNPTPQDTTPDLAEALDQEQMNAQELGEIKQRSVIGAISYILRTGILQIIGFAASLLLSAFFSPEDFGVYGLVTQVIGLLVFFSDIGLAAALIQKKEHPSLSEYRTAFTVQQALSWLIVGITGIILATGIIQQKTGQVGVWVLLSLALSFPLASLKTIPSIKLIRKLDFSRSVLPQIFEQLTFYGILVFLAWRGMGAMAYTYAVLARSMVGVGVMWIIQPWKIGLAFDKKALKELIGFGAKFQLSDFLARVKDQLFFIVLGLFFPLNQFGYIQWAKTWSQYPYNLTVQNVLAITFPTFSRLQKHPGALKKAIEKSIFFITLAIFPILVGMSVLIGPLTQAVSSYAKWQPAVLSFVLFTLSIGWSALSTPLVNTLNAIGQINTTLKLMVLWTILTWLISPVLIYFFGFNGVALASFIISFTSFLPVILVKRHVPVKILPEVWRQLLAATAMGLVGIFLQNFAANRLTNLILTGLIISFTYGLVMTIVGWKKLVREVKALL